MEYFDAVRHRRSVRAYTSDEVSKEQLQTILECANAAPSAGNLQAYEILVITDAGTKQSLARALLGQHFLAQAPIVLAFFKNGKLCARYGRRGETLYALQDATIACTYAQLAATALGLATCWIGAFQDEAVAKILKARKGMVPVALLPIGYAGENAAPSSRRSLDDIVRWESF